MYSVLNLILQSLKPSMLYAKLKWLGACRDCTKHFDGLYLHVYIDKGPCTYMYNSHVCVWYASLLPITQVTKHTSVGPAYIIGDGNIARTVLSGSSTPSSRTAWCCLMRVLRGTSSAFVQPPRGWRRRTGFWKPRLRIISRVSCEEIHCNDCHWEECVPELTYVCKTPRPSDWPCPPLISGTGSPILLIIMRLPSNIYMY